MKNHIFSLALLGAASLTAFAQSGTTLVVTEKTGEVSKFDSENVAGILFENAPDYTNVPVVLSSVYGTLEDNAYYEVQLGETVPNPEGDPVNVGDVQTSLYFIAPVSEDAYNAVLPEGYYRISSGTSPFTFSATKSVVWERTETEIESNFIIDGVVDVRRDGRNYDIRAELSTLSGKKYNLRYQGAITFELGTSDYEQLNEDIEINFSGAQLRFYANWSVPFASDMMLQLYNGTFDDFDRQVEGAWMNIECYGPKYDDPVSIANPVVADGVYDVDFREEVPYYYYAPYTFSPGRLEYFFGQYVDVGSYVTIVEKNGRRFKAHLVGGSFTVSEDGTMIEVDFISENGHHVRGTYEGSVVSRNFCDNDQSEPKRPYSTLDTNYELEFNDNQLGVIFSEGEILLKDKNFMTLMIANIDLLNGAVPTQKRSDYIQLNYISDTVELPNGIYDISNELENFNFFVGGVDFGGNIIHSWMGDLASTDADGYQSILAPIAKGTITVSGDDTNKRIEFDVMDDNGNQIAGVYEGPVIDITPEPEAQRLRHNAMKKSGKLRVNRR